MNLDNLPGIKRAALIIAYDNGCVNILCTEQEILDSAAKVVEAQSAVYDIEPIDQYLEDLSDKEMQTICCGDELDQFIMIRMAPENTDELLHMIWMELC